LQTSALQSIVENFNPRGLRNYWKSSFLAGIPDQAVETMVEHFAQVVGPCTHIVIEHMGGAAARIAAGSAAVAHRNVPYNLNIVGMWADPSEDEAGVRWVGDLWTTMQRFSNGGVYVNYLGAESDEGASRIRSVYPPEIYSRLLEVKQKFDPGNCFRLNHNIRPASGAGA
jgi:hypothetical protein